MTEAGQGGERGSAAAATNSHIKEPGGEGGGGGIGEIRHLRAAPVAYAPHISIAHSGPGQRWQPDKVVNKEISKNSDPYGWPPNAKNFCLKEFLTHSLSRSNVFFSTIKKENSSFQGLLSVSLSFILSLSLSHTLSPSHLALSPSHFDVSVSLSSLCA